MITFRWCIVVGCIFAPGVAAPASPIFDGAPLESYDSAPGSFRGQYASYSSGYINFGYTTIYGPVSNPGHLSFSNVPFEEWMLFPSPGASPGGGDGLPFIPGSMASDSQSWLDLTGVLNGETHGSIGITATLKSLYFKNLPPALQGLADGSEHLELSTYYGGSDGRLTISALIVPNDPGGTTQPVPEPSTGLAFLAALAGAGLRRISRR
jgi:hypothetical protein